VRKRGGNNRANEGSGLRGLEAGRVGQEGSLRAVGAGLCQPFTGQTAPARILASSLQPGNDREAWGGTRAQVPVNCSVLVGPTSHEGEQEIGQHRQDGQPDMPCSLCFPQGNHLNEHATV
jgi:hypothetical protein